MCGIAGVINLDNRPVHNTDVSDMLSMMKHRGQDNTGILNCSQKDGKFNYREHGGYSVFCFGHNRLSIIDLSKNGNQPMMSQCGNYIVTFNGEIYNYIELRNELRRLGHQFNTNTDTEVLIVAYKEWGDSCLLKLDGMFSFCLWDAIKSEYTIARDRIGVKPLYYRQSDSEIIFASEAEAIAKTYDTRISREGLFAYLNYMYVPAPWSIYEGVKKLEPGHYIKIFQGGSVVTKEFWNLDNQEAIIDDVDDERMNELMTEVMTLQVRSDVPVGSFLSGGIDSGLLTALASEKTKLNTFSVGYEGAAVNELSTARSISKKYNTEHHELIIRNNSVLELLDTSMAYCSEPIADSALVPTYLLSEMASSLGIKVLINGTGGDEIFGGYTRYLPENRLRIALERLPKGIRKSIGQLLTSFGMKEGFRLMNTGLDMAINVGGSFDATRILWNDKRVYFNLVRKSMEKNFKELIGKHHIITQKMMHDTKSYLPDQLLLMLDQMTMAHTTEGRVPFLGNRIVEFGFGLNPSHHIQPGQTKKLLRKYAETYLGKEITGLKKQGFGGPSFLWMTKNKTKVIQEVEKLNEIGIDINKQFLSSILNCFNETKSRIDLTTIYRLYCFSVWVQTHHH